MSDNDNSNREPPHPKKSPMPITRAVIIGNGNTESPPPKPKAGDSSKPIHIRDLDLAEWTSKLVWWTRVLVFATTVTAGVGYLQWNELQKAGRQTDDTIRALKRQADDFEAVQAASIALPYLGFTTTDAPGSSDPVWKVILKFRNSGSTEPKNVKLKLNINKIMKTSEMTPTPTLNDEWWGKLLASDKLLPIPFDIKNGADINVFSWKATEVKDDVVAIFGIIEYDPIFKNLPRRRREICWFMVPSVAPAPPTEVTCANHNCADDECKN